MNQIQCLMISGGPLDQGLSTAMLFAARSLIGTKHKTARFKDENGEGGVSTRHRRLYVASGLTGIEFLATVECGDRTVRCRFLVNDINMPSDDWLIENGRWVDFDLTFSDETDGDWWKDN